MIKAIQRDRISLPLLTVIVALSIYFIPVFLGQNLVMGNDGLLLFYPTEQALAEALRQGTLPFWAPEIQAGFPLLADGQPGALYPPNLLAFGLLPTPLAHNLLTIVHAFLGLLFVYWWGRTLHRSRTASALMGLVFALATPLTGSKMPVLETLAWTPLLFVLTERFVQRRSLLSAMVMTPVLALQWLAGFPQMALYSLIAGFFYFCSRLWFEEPDRRHAVTLVLIWGVPVVLGIGLAAPQLLPTYELAQHSIRAGGISGSMAGEKSLFPAALVTLVLPAWQSFFAGAGLGFGVYMGILPLVLAITALARRPDRPWTLPLLVVSIVTIILSFGRFSPLFPILRELPGFSSFRVPSRFLIMTQLSLVALTGFGWDATFAQNREQQPWMSRLFNAAVLLLVGNTFIGYPLLSWLRPHLLRFAESFTRRHIFSDPYHVQPWSYYRAKIDRLYDALLDATIWSNLEVMVPFLVLLAVWVLWRMRRSLPSRRLAGIWGFLIGVDLFIIGGVAGTMPTFWVTQPPETAEVLATSTSSQPCRFFRVVDDDLATASSAVRRQTLSANYNMLFDLAGTGVYSPLGMANYHDFMRELSTVNLAFGLRPTTPEKVTKYRPLLNLLNVCHVLSRQPLEAFTPVTTIGDIYLYRNTEAFPRAFLVDRTATAASAAEAVEWTKTHRAGLQETAIVESQQPLSLPANTAATSHVAIQRYEQTRVEFQTSASGDVLLVLTDMFYPGWHATIDGAPARIYRAYGLFRAIVIPSGEHHVTFTYTSDTFRRGLLLASIICVLWLLLIARTIQRS